MWRSIGGREFSEGSVESSNGGNEASCFETGSGPGVEGEATSVCLLEGGYVPALILHDELSVMNCQ